MSAQLLPCPFCGAGETRVDIKTYWTGMRSELLNAEVVHWCPDSAGRPQNFIRIKGKDEEDAVLIWNTRSEGK